MITTKKLKNMYSNRKLFIIRGLPGSGKTSLAQLLTQEHYEADMFFERGNGYEFDPTKLREAHEWCRDLVMMAMERDEKTIAVSNTFTQEWEMKPYLDLAQKFGYTVFSMIVENRHEGKNIHGCPEEKVEQMRNRFEIKL